MGLPLFKSKFEEDIKVPDTCPFCGHDLVKPKNKIFGGCHFCSPKQESLAEHVARSILDVNTSFYSEDPQQVRPAQRIRKKNNSRFRQRLLDFNKRSEQEKKLTFGMAFSLGFLATLIGGLLAFLVVSVKLSHLFPPFMTDTVYFPKNLIISNIEFNGGSSPKLTFTVTNKAILSVSDFDIGVGIFSSDGELLSTETFTGKQILAANSKRSFLSITSVVDPGGSQSFSLKLSKDAELISVVPFRVKYLM
ncbi:MAG: hypothetical protein NZT61_04670 [Deltaproteobacteria bacterium]|nr:hypothetical protein [Deltaproteobacteria bacterium]MCX7952157.1 hypothetical protein [Deltaproteobacteria bacterium]